jgi:hypothetical protein
MKRRTILQYTAYATGAVVGAPLVSVLLSGCQSEVVGNYQPVFFNEEEFGLVKNLVDLILPKTDSPSATEVGVHQMIDNMVSKVYTVEQQTDFRKGFEALSKYLTEAGFEKMKAAKQLALLQKLDVSTEDSLKAVQAAFLDFKQQTIAYYLSTEEIGMNYLNYLPVPGEYQPCISLEEAGGKAWAI